jgi:hypothetical protein
MNIIIAFSYTEKMRLFNHASFVLHGGHWGSSDLIIPEQQSLLKKIEDLDGEIELSFEACKMLTDWMCEGMHEGVHILPEDSAIITKVSGALADYYDRYKKSVFRELNNIEDAINVVNELAGRPGIDVTPNIKNTEKPDNDNQEVVLDELHALNEKLDALNRVIGTELFT